MKIGITDDVLKRRDEINSGNDRFLHIHAQEELKSESEAKRIERSLHYHFREKHIRGEWFALTENDVEAFGSAISGLKGHLGVISLGTLTP